MRIQCAVCFTALLLALAGCAPKSGIEGPAVDSFTGRVTHDGKPVSFPPGSNASLTIFHEKGRRFGIPLAPDGTFTIGRMPIGQYTVMFESPPKGAKGPGTKYTVPGGLKIEEGKTDYTIELGKDWKL